MTKHTPGPWIAAAKPSSVVGLPVVAQSGRSIASVTFFDLGEKFANHDRESAANARLIAAAPRMYDFVEEKARYGDEEARAILDAISGRTHTTPKGGDDE